MSMHFSFYRNWLLWSWKVDKMHRSPVGLCELCRYCKPIRSSGHHSHDYNDSRGKIRMFFRAIEIRLGLKNTTVLNGTIRRILKLLWQFKINSHYNKLYLICHIFMEEFLIFITKPFIVHFTSTLLGLFTSTLLGLFTSTLLGLFTSTLLGLFKPGTATR